jgi:ABC-type transport system involved in cytochrome c biogenesis permease subunit
VIALAHLLAIGCYVAAAFLAAAPFVRPVGAPVRTVLALLGVGVATHLAALVGFALDTGQLPLFGLGPALTSAAFLLALTLLCVEALAREVTLTLLAAPFAALLATLALAAGLAPAAEPAGARGVWLVAHVALSFAGIAAFATAAAAGAMYLVQRRELKSRRFGSVFRLFPPLATLDRVNHVATLVAWLGLTGGVVLATSYAIVYHRADAPKVVWAISAWLSVSAVTFGRVLGGWQARRAALLTSVSFAAVLVLYVVMRAIGAAPGRFL